MKLAYTLNPAAVKRYFTASRKKSALFMQHTDGVTYLTDGKAVVIARNPAEYEAILRPVTARDPGDWTFAPGNDPAPGTVDTKKAVSDALADAENAVFTPLSADLKGASVRLFWLPEKSAAAAVSAALVDMISRPDGVAFTAAGPLSGVGVWDDGFDVPAAFFMPVRITSSPDLLRAVSAFYQGDSAAAELAACKARLASAETVARNALAGERAARAAAKSPRKRFTIKRHAEKAVSAPVPVSPKEAAPAPENDAAAEKRETVSKSDALAALLDLLEKTPALMCEVRGAKSAAPIMWVSGDTRPHKDLLKAAGFKWSPKKSAWWAKKTA